MMFYMALAGISSIKKMKYIMLVRNMQPDS